MKPEIKINYDFFREEKDNPYNIEQTEVLRQDYFNKINEAIDADCRRCEISKIKKIYANRLRKLLKRNDY